jgi:hypothetical protein
VTSERQAGPTIATDKAVVADALGPLRSLDELREQLQGALKAAQGLADASTDSRVTRPVIDAAALLAQALNTSSTAAIPTARLTVALMGRTKAGKSQLVAALTGDLEADGVGQGRHRTTRTERTTSLDGFDLIDLPGVAALDGEHDTRLAVQAAASADAVLWLYAESLQDTEAVELEDLLRKGKPVVVAFNAKWSVDAEARRRVFEKHPELAFRDLPSHRERIGQIAARAGTQTPPFVAVHARAAWWAACEERPDLGRASRIDELTRACDSALTSRAAVLRIRARHDRPRRRLQELGTAARLIAGELGDGHQLLSQHLEREAESLVRALAEAHDDASVRLDAAMADAHKGLSRWVRKHRDSDEERLNADWNKYLVSTGFTVLLDQYVDDVRSEIKRSRTTIHATEFVDRKFQSTKRLTASSDRGLWGRVKSGLRALRRATAASLRAIGVDRGVAMLFAKLAGRAVPGVGWWLVGVDAVQGLSTGTREELAARRIRADEWGKDQLIACEDELALARELVAASLAGADEATRTQVEARLSDAKKALQAASQLREGLVSASDAARAAVSACDRDLVTALLAHDGFIIGVRDVRRVPNEEAVVTFRRRGDPALALAALNEHLAPECVIDRAGARRRKVGRTPRRRGM